MARFNIQDVHALENIPTSPASLSAKLGDMVLNSTVCKATVDSINTETGEYRIVLQGTIEAAEKKT